MVFSHLWTNTWTLPSSSRVDHSLCGRSRRGSSRKLHLISLSSGITYWYWRWRIFDYLYGGTQRHSCCSLIFWHQILFQVIFKDLFGPYGWSLFVLPKHKKHKVQTIFQILLITLFLIWVFVFTSWSACAFHSLSYSCFIIIIIIIIIVIKLFWRGAYFPSWVPVQKRPQMPIGINDKSHFKWLFETSLNFFFKFLKWLFEKSFQMTRLWK